MATTVTLKPNAIDLSGSTSGTTTLQATAVAGTTTITFPAATDTLVGKATTDTLTNKTLTSPVISTISNTGTLTLPTSTDTLVGRATTDTLTNKTLTTPVISSLSSASATALTLQSAGTTAVTIDTSQNVGIGTTTPNTRIQSTVGSNGSGVVVGLRLQNVGTTAGDGAKILFTAGTSTNGAGISSTGVALDSADLRFDTGGSNERMRIGSDGRLFVNSTSTASYFDGKINSYGDAAVPALCLKNDGTGGQFTASFWNMLTSGNNIFANFLTETSPTIRGSISYNRSGGLTVYNTTSDYRAKTVTGSVQNALSKVALLKPSTGRMNGATEDIDFFVAHELQEVVPSAVTGEKDAVNEDSTPKYQMVDKSALIPLLTKAIQELKAINDTQAETINALTARVVALEAK